ncbi:MAG: vWA domain-containing protein [Actinophytocola sp.]|uniref:vWA domain-containing protein n=1 Tax=Actinophytocola sp. TaxID=1872138 RepID=UPI003D6B3F3E
MSSARKMVALVGVLVGVMVGAVLAAPSTASATGETDELAPVVVVLDASGSMREPIAGGDTKMAAAKDAVHTLVGALPTEARLGMAVYGTGTGSSAGEKAAGCRDVRVVHDVAPLDRPALDAAVDEVEPRGYTPIGQSLRTAAAELPTEGPRSIVLVSDGEDTCAPPAPCEVAKELEEKGADLRVHAIGFDVDDKARQQLACAARATGGEYVDARDAGALIRALNRVGQRALRAYEPVGTPVAGTRAPAGAPRVGAGAYLDRIGPDESRFYAVDVPRGYTLYASASAVVADDVDYLLHVGRYDGDAGQACSGEATEVKTEGPVVSALHRWSPPERDADPCERAGVQLVRVSLEAVAPATSPSALELLIGLEPKVSGDAGPPGTTERTSFVPPNGPAEPVAGGGSFGTATELAGSGGYVDTVLSGEMVFYKVRLDWGQGLAYRLRMGEQDGVGGLFVKTAWYNPAREEQDADSTSYTGREQALPASGDSLGGPPVRYRNRVLPGPEVGPGVAMAGWYYLSVLVDQTYEPRAVPVTLEVSVGTGTEPGPRYEGDGGADPFGDRGPAPDLVEPAGDRAGLAAAFGETSPLLYVGIPLVVLAIVLTVGLLLVRHRRRV